MAYLGADKNVDGYIIFSLADSEYLYRTRCRLHGCKFIVRKVKWSYFYC